jgi:PST family polysaccharide transporter
MSRIAVRSVVWQGASFLLGRGFNLAATVVLARLLTPHDFGVVGLALVFITFAEYVSDLGVAQALVYFETGQRERDNALLLSLLSGLVLAGVALLAAPLIARFFHHPEVAPMVRVLAATLFVSAARQVPDALLRRALEFRRRVVIQIAQSLTQGLVSIALAVGGAGPWSIAWGYFAGVAVAWLVTWMRVGYRPQLGGLRLQREPTRRLLGYGAPAAAQGLLAALIFDVDYIIVGSALGAQALGIYTLAFRLPQLLIINVFGVLSSVAFPLYSRAGGDRERLRRGYLTSLRLQTAYGAAAGAGLFMVAPLVVPVLLGPRWHASIAALEPLALYAAARALGAGAVDVYKGMGRPAIGAVVGAIRLAILVPALLVAVGGGVDAVAWTQAAFALAFAIGMQAVATRIVGMSPADLLATLRPGLALAVGAAAGSGVVRLLVTGIGVPQLIAAVAAGVAVGLLALRLLDAPFVAETRALLGRERGPSAVAST